jgi:hypothetical protein
MNRSRGPRGREPAEDVNLVRVARTGSGLAHRNTIVATRVRVRLFDGFLKPMGGAPYRLVLGSRILEGNADGDGWVPPVWVVDVPEIATVSWGRAAEDEADPYEGIEEVSEDGTCSGAQPTAKTPAGDVPPFLHELDLHVTLEADEEKAAEQRLDNLGFLFGEKLADRIESFQRAYGKTATGLVADVRAALFGGHDDCAPEPCPPPSGAD